jgi:hypothetical protein
MTMAGLRHAFKEWAAVCRALADGRQTVLLRKGGVAEPGGAFRVEHDRFWLYPTFVHQQEAGVAPEALPLLRAAVAERPAEGVVRLTHFAAVEGAYEVGDLASALALQGLHVWSPEAVRSRFAYRRPGLLVLAVRIFAADEAHQVVETPEYAGCRSWVELADELPADGRPVLSNEAFLAQLRLVEAILRPTATV